MPQASKTPLILIACIAFLTPLASTAMFFLWRPAHSTHHGEIVAAQTAALPSPSWTVAGGGKVDIEKWRGKWTLLYATQTADCGEQCRKRLCQMRQLRLMSHGSYLRLHRAWLINTPAAAATTGAALPAKITTPGACGETLAAELATERESPEVEILQGVEILRGDIAVLPPPSGNLRRQDYLYLADPAGRLAMRFPPALNIYKIRQDLSRLLKLSKGWLQTQ